MSEWVHITLGPCGAERYFPDAYTAGLHSSEVGEEHREKCRACAVIEGRSKARVLNQDEIAACFVNGIDGLESPTGNLSSEAGFLWHYGTIEAVRLIDTNVNPYTSGAIVGNSQCWSAGFARCPTFRADYSLPLTTIYIEVTREIRNIMILDTHEGDTLFRFKDKYYLAGWDERGFLTELPVEVSTVKEALESLAPESVKWRRRDGHTVKRQGDLFFLPAEEERPFPEEGAIIERQHFEEGTVTWDMTAKRLIRPAILDTTHTAGELVKTNRGIFVRGQIRHGSIRNFNRQHRTLDLGTEWHFAVKNLAVQSWNVARGGGGGID